VLGHGKSHARPPCSPARRTWQPCKSFGPQASGSLRQAGCTAACPFGRTLQASAAPSRRVRRRTQWSKVNLYCDDSLSLTGQHRVRNSSAWLAALRPLAVASHSDSPPRADARTISPRLVGPYGPTSHRRGFAWHRGPAGPLAVASLFHLPVTPSQSRRTVATARRPLRANIASRPAIDGS